MLPLSLCLVSIEVIQLVQDIPLIAKHDMSYALLEHSHFSVAVNA